MKYIFKSLFLLIIIVSCNKPPEKNLKIFRYNEYSNISSLDPAFSSTLRNMWPCNQLYNGLVRLDNNLMVKADIAKEWYFDDKKNEYDFALWKKAEKNHLMKWRSPWSDGFPGWHLECTAMSNKYLGDEFDIHGGGIDLKFPHHECEIAQAVGYTGKQPAKFWIHTNMPVSYTHLRAHET